MRILLIIFAVFLGVTVGLFVGFVGVGVITWGIVVAIKGNDINQISQIGGAIGAQVGSIFGGLLGFKIAKKLSNKNAKNHNSGKTKNHIAEN